MLDTGITCHARVTASLHLFLFSWILSSFNIYYLSYVPVCLSRFLFRKLYTTVLYVYIRVCTRSRQLTQ